MKSAAQVRPSCLLRAIPSRMEQVDQVCDELRIFLRERQLDGIAFGVELVARECLNNAVLHGNAGNRRKRVMLHLLCGRKWICIQVTDQGAGFNWRKAREAAVDLAATSGRGLPILQQYADRIRFNRRGNQVTLWLNRPRLNSRA